MRLGGNELRHRVCQGRERVDVEDRERVLAVIQSSAGEDDRNEVDAERSQQVDLA